MTEIPKDAKKILEKLNNAGYEAYLVGGCVRDSLLGKTPEDFDICTNAVPLQTMEVFSDCYVIPTGIKHGTVTVMLSGKGYEITTYRLDGSYSDGRHPDSVSFSSSLREDSSRRDFTINAMAYSDKDGIMDFFGGIDDLKNGIIRCVGEPEKRFCEDALRIMRAIRFASVLDFKIDESTDMAMKKLYKNLDKVANERINVEFNKMLCGKNPVFYLDKYDCIFFHIIPELEQMKGCLQHNPYHSLDVWKHTLEVLRNIEQCDVVLRLAALFHDIGKPQVFTMSEDGIGHFYGHAEKSAEIAENVMKRLKYSGDMISEVVTLVKYHDIPITKSKKFVRRMIGKMGEAAFERLLSLSRADVLGQSGKDREVRLDNIEQTRHILAEFDKENECFSLKQLKIDGDELIKMGIKPGKEMGRILDELLKMVIDEKIENDENLLAEYVKKAYLNQNC